MRVIAGLFAVGMMLAPVAMGAEQGCWDTMSKCVKSADWTKEKCEQKGKTWGDDCTKPNPKLAKSKLTGVCKAPTATTWVWQNNGQPAKDNLKKMCDDQKGTVSDK